MYCKECGKEIDGDSKYCSFCGKRQSVNLIKDGKSIPNTEPQNKNNISESSNEKNIKIVEKIEKYDEAYSGDSEATIVGAMVMVVYLILLFTVKFDNENDQNSYRAIAAFVNIIWRIIVTVWIVNIAKRQNRDSTAWGIFAFVIPNLALIIIGLLKKIRDYSSIQKDEEELQIDESSMQKSASENFFDYKVKDVITIESFWTGTKVEYIIEFSNGKIGKVYGLRNSWFYYVHRIKHKNIYYPSKDSAIEGLYYFLESFKISDKNRLDF